MEKSPWGGSLPKICWIKNVWICTQTQVVCIKIHWLSSFHYFYSPEHEKPSPWNPFLHLHSYPPCLFWHSANSWHMCVPNSHSFSSTQFHVLKFVLIFLMCKRVPWHMNPSPVNPWMHEHSYPPSVLLQSAFTWQLCLDNSHSFSSEKYLRGSYVSWSINESLWFKVENRILFCQWLNFFWVFLVL